MTSCIFRSTPPLKRITSCFSCFKTRASIRIIFPWSSPSNPRLDPIDSKSSYRFFGRRRVPKYEAHTHLVLMFQWSMCHSWSWHWHHHHNGSLPGWMGDKESLRLHWAGMEGGFSEYEWSEESSWLYKLCFWRTKGETCKNVTCSLYWNPF